MLHDTIYIILNIVSSLLPYHNIDVNQLYSLMSSLMTPLQRSIGIISIGILVGLIVFLLVRFVWQRNEYWYIWPNTNSSGYRYLIQGLSSWSRYQSWVSGELQRAQEYFARASSANTDTVLWEMLEKNLRKVQERSQIELIRECVYRISVIWQTRNTIEQSYGQLFDILQQQITTIPRVITLQTNTSKVSCLQEYAQHLTKTSATIIAYSNQRWSTQKQYQSTIDQYPSILGSCETIIAIDQQSQALKQEVEWLTTKYQEYQRILEDPNRHGELCGLWSDTVSPQQSTRTATFMPLDRTSIQQAIDTIKQRSQNTRTTIQSGS